MQRKCWRIDFSTLVLHAGGAKRAYVDPDIRNEKALSLYDRLGFRSAPWPQQVEATEGHVYLEISAPHTTKE